MIRPLALAILPLALLLSGCLSQPVPTQHDPACSWTSAPAPSPDALCRSVFKTLALLTKAERTGDDATVRRLAAPAVARKIIRHGRALRRLGLSNLHVVPSIALDTSGVGDVGAGFYLLGVTRHGRVKAQQSVYLARSGGEMRVIHDQPAQEW